MTKLHDLARLGQSVWYDNIQRALLDGGGLQDLIDSGVLGVTSNPSIFQKAIAGSSDYDQAMAALVVQDKTDEEIFEALALEDIQRAADLLRPIYDRTAGVDGYVSLEVSPRLAHDTDATIADARRLFAALDRPNIMIKVPATPAGIPAIKTLIGSGININVTLMFSLDHYDAVAEAYIAGLEKLAAAGGDPSMVASVASFFVSRVDTAVDNALDSLQPPASNIQSLRGTIAIANSKLAYARFLETFSGPRWERLVAMGARVQRPLWASTSTKNPAYPETLYVDALIGPNTVNTVPPATIDAFHDHGTVASTVETGLDEARQQLAQLAGLGIDLDIITEQLQDDGVAAFAQAFDSLLASIAAKRQQLLSPKLRHSAVLGPYQAVVDAALTEMACTRIVDRIWSHDHTVWKPEPTEITNRLGWLTVPRVMLAQVANLQAFRKEVLADGITEVLLLGMGGSSLAPDVFAKVFGATSSLNLQVLDSTDPAAVLSQTERLDPAKTLFIVATKSGGTAETLSFFKHFYNWSADALGSDSAGRHFVAITDPGSKLAKLARQYDFRVTYLNPPHIGGRYSVLSYFGLVPAALVGVDLKGLLDRALACDCGSCDCSARGDDGAWLGAIMAQLARAGRDKVTLITSPPLANFGDWVEQLVAESTGKDGKGILPVVGERLGTPEVYGGDRLFVYLRLDGDSFYDSQVRALGEAGHPVVRLRLRDLFDLGEQFFLWEMATAVTSYHLGINPFDQPNVEAAKVLGRQVIASYAETGVLPTDKPAHLSPDTLKAFLEQATTGDYISLQAYIQPTARSSEALEGLRTLLRDRLKLAVTVGYGPRFLHSTGQLHKGDSGNGLFVQFTADESQDVPIPDEAGRSESSITFGILKTAQALGDKQALLDKGRRVIRFHLGNDVAGGLSILARAIV
jgi:transaldolase/glucose-6-phosphate isomerase